LRKSSSYKEKWQLILDQRPIGPGFYRKQESTGDTSFTGSE
jgi:hypothetical protein